MTKSGRLGWKASNSSQTACGTITLSKISRSSPSSPALSSVVTAVVSVTTVISVDQQVDGIVSGQALERVQVQPQFFRFVIDRNSPTAEFIQELRRRQTADFGRPPQR